MSRLSFSYSLLAGFLLIAAILGSAALSGLGALEAFAERSRSDANNALHATAAIRQLAERTLDMERSARQFLVLEDVVLLDRFDQAHSDSRGALRRIEALDLPHVGALIDSWRDTATLAALAIRESTNSNSNAEIADALGQLAPINEQLATAVRVQLGRDSQHLLEELETNRSRLALHVATAFIAASLLAALTGWWIVRPLRKVEQAIEALGESQFDAPVAIAGPADLGRVGQRLDWLRQRLADLETNRARVLRHVSHELKTPLAALREGVALLEDRVVGGLNNDQREVVAILESNSRVLQDRIEALLGYNAAVFDARTLKRGPVDLDALIQTVLDEQRLAIKTRWVRITRVGTAPTLNADRDKLEIVLANLIANAVSFSPDGGEVRLELSSKPGKVCIDCMDEGPGVMPDDADRIFEPYFQGAQRQQAAVTERNGSGLGLAIVREFVIAHGGTVALRPSARGAHFRVELPHDH